MNNETVTVHCVVSEDDFISVGPINDVGDVEIEMRTSNGTQVCWIKAGVDLDTMIKALKNRRKLYRKGRHKMG